MQSFFGAINFIAVLIIWHTLSNVDMRQGTGQQAGFSSQKRSHNNNNNHHNNRRSNANYNSNSNSNNRSSNDRFQGHSITQQVPFSYPVHQNQYQGHNGKGQQSYGAVSGYQQPYNAQNFNAPSYNSQNYSAPNYVNNDPNVSGNGYGGPPAPQPVYYGNENGNVNGYYQSVGVQNGNGGQGGYGAAPMMSGYPASGQGQYVNAPQEPYSGSAQGQYAVPAHTQYQAQYPVPAQAQYAPTNNGYGNYMPPPASEQVYGTPLPIPQHQNVQQDLPYNIAPPPGQHMIPAPVPQMNPYMEVPLQHPPSFSIPPPPIPSQYLPQQEMVEELQFQEEEVYNEEVYDEDIQDQDPQAPEIPELFVNHGIIAPGQVFHNSDGYSEAYNGVKSQPLVIDKYHRQSEETVQVEGPSIVVSVKEEIKEEVIVDVKEQEKPAELAIEEPKVEILTPTAEKPEEEAVQEIPKSLRDYTFTGDNFPMLPREGVAPEIAEEFNNLLATITNSIKDFFQKKEEVWNQSDVKHRYESHEEYSFTTERLSPDDGFPFTSNSASPATEPQPSTPVAGAEVPPADEDDMVTIEFFIPTVPVKVPRSYLEQVNPNEEGFSQNLLGNCFTLSSHRDDLFEKEIKKEAFEKFMNSKSKHLPIEFSRSEKQRIAELYYSGQDTTIVMRAEFPSEPSSSHGSPARNPPGSPAEGPAEDANSPESSSGEADTSPNTSNDTDRQPGPSEQQGRVSRLNGYTDQNGTPNRGRSASNFGPSTFTRNFRGYPWDPRAYNLPTSSASGGQEGRSKPGPSRKLPAIPQQYLNGQDTSSGIERSWSEFGSRSVPRAESMDSPNLARRRHQSQDGSRRVQNGQYPQPWMNEHPHLRFIIPTERELMARVPFPPFRIPLIGVARREPGQPYIPQRILPAHENYEIFRLRMQEIQDSSMPSRGNGALILEPRGFMAQRQDSDEESTAPNDPSTSDAPHRQQEALPDPQDLEQSEFRKRFMFEQEDARKRRETATSCRMMSPYFRYHNDSTDDDEEDGPTCSGGPSSQPSTSAAAAPSANAPCSSNSGQSSSQPTSTSKNNQRSSPKPKAVRDTAAKNQRRRDRDERRNLRKEEEKVRLIEVEELSRIEAEKLAAKQEEAAEKKKLRQEKEAKKLEIKEAERKAQEEAARVLEEERKAKLEKERCDKRRFLNQINRNKKKASKRNKRAAEEEKARQEEIVQKLLERDEVQHDNQKAFNISVLSMLAEAKKKLDKHENKTTGEKVKKFLEKPENQVDDVEEKKLKETVDSVIVELEKVEEVDTRSLFERSTDIFWFYKDDESFRADVKEQVETLESDRFEMTRKILQLREIAAMQKYALTQQLIHLKAVRQYRYWMENLTNEVSYFVNFVVGITDQKYDDPTIEKFEKWTIYENEKYQVVTAFETSI